MYLKQISATNGYIYITLLDVTSSLIALYGLLLLQKILMPLLHTHNIRGKFFSLQVYKYFKGYILITIS